MGAAMCTADAECSRCGRRERQGLERSDEYKPQGKLAGLKEEVERPFPIASNVGSTLERRLHAFQWPSKELSKDARDAEVAASDVSLVFGAAHAAAGAAAKAAHAVQAAAASALASITEHDTAADEVANQALEAQEVTEAANACPADCAARLGLERASDELNAEVQRRELGQQLRSTEELLMSVCPTRDRFGFGALPLPGRPAPPTGAWSGLRTSTANPCLSVHACGGLKGRGFDPVQAAAWNTQGIVAKAKAEILEISSMVHHGHCTLRLFCFLVALALLASSAPTAQHTCLEVLSFARIFGVALTPFQYLTSVYNMIFAVVIIVVEVSAVFPGKLLRMRTRIFEACWFLSNAKGKALFYFYVGSMNLVMLADGDLRLIYLGIGGGLCSAGLWVSTDHCGCCCRRTQHSLAEEVADSARHNAAAAINRVHEATTGAVMEYLRIKHSIEQHPMTLRMVCFLISIALLVSSILGILNIFNALFDPFNYLIAAYNIVFAIIIALLDARRDWMVRCWNIRMKILQAAPCLGWLVGRGLFFLYIGSINLTMYPESWLWRCIYFCIGGGLCIAGLLMLLHRYVCRSKQLDDLMGFTEET